MPKALDECVGRLIANPKFKPRKKGQSKKSAAYAVCSASLKQEINRPYVASKHDSKIALAEEIGEKGSLRFEIKNKVPIKKTKKGLLPKKIELFRSGTYKHPYYGDMEMSKEVLKDYVVSFEARLEAKGPNREENILPIDANHKGGPAYGWIKKLSVSEDGEILWAHIKEWTKLGKEAIEDNLYRYVSAEFYVKGYLDFQTAEEEENVMVAATLTNQPYMQVLMPVSLILDKKTKIVEDDEGTMKLKKVLKKDPEKLSKKEIVFIKDKVAKLSKADKKKFASVLKTKKKSTRKTKKTDKGIVKVGKKKFAKMEKDLKAFRTSEKTAKAEKLIDKYVVKEGNKKARFLKKQRDGLVDFVLSLDKEQKVAFKSLVKEMPKLSIYGEIGEGEGGSTKEFSKELRERIAKYRKENKGATFTQARKAVFEKSPKLKAEYEEGLDDKDED